VSPAITQLLESQGIRLVSEAREYVMLARDNCVALVRMENGVCSIGSTGLLTGNGLAYLVKRGERDFLVAKGIESPALPEEVEAIRKFSNDLKALIL
jgi:hypothetical protein